jgi:hypothetical protein
MTVIRSNPLSCLHSMMPIAIVSAVDLSADDRPATDTAGTYVRVVFVSMAGPLNNKRNIRLPYARRVGFTGPESYPTSRIVSRVNPVFAVCHSFAR